MKPNSITFQIWLRFLKHAFKMEQNGNKSNKLEIWRETPDTSGNIWNNYFDKEREKLIIKKDVTYEAHRLISVERLTSFFQLAKKTWGIVPTTAIPATITRSENNIIIANFQKDNCIERNIEVIYKDKNNTTKFEKFLMQQTRWEQDLCSNWSSNSI